MFLRLIVGILLTILVVGMISKIRKHFLEAKPKVSAGDTIKCAYCGVYIPSNDVIRRRGKAFCSQIHADKDN